MKHCVHTFTRQIATQVKAQIAQTLPEISAKTSPPSKNSSKKVWPVQMQWWKESYLSIALKDPQVPTASIVVLLENQVP